MGTESLSSRFSIADQAFEAAFTHTVGIEGDFSDDPADSGGATRFGITEVVARANGYHGDMRELPFERARAIYRAQYWDLLRLGDVARQSYRVAAELFDTAVNRGQAAAAVYLQRALNALNDGDSRWPDVKVDGAIGPVTVFVLRELLIKRGVDGETVLLRALNALQGADYIRIAEQRPKDERFVHGWLLNRVTL